MNQEMKFMVVDLNNPDPVESVWVRFPTKELAEAWVENFNNNTQRRRNFAVKPIGDLNEVQATKNI